MKRTRSLGRLLICCFVALGATCPALAEKPHDEKRSLAPAAVKNTEKNTDDEQRLRLSAEEFVKAFNSHDERAIAALFTAEGEIICEDGTVTQGTAAIEKLFAYEFEANPDDRMAIEIDTLRFLNADTANEEGRLLVTDATNKRSSSIRYSVIHVREGDSWLVASARNYPREETVSAHEHLKQLEWMIGDWVHEGPDSMVTVSCRWDDSGNFLLRDYSVRRAGQVVMSCTHRIGWDPMGKQLKSWTFDSEGGQASGHWHHQGDRWILQLTGVSADGRLGTATHIYTQASPHRTKWQAVERTLGGESLDDLDEVSIVRAPGTPERRAKHQIKNSQ